MTSKLRTEVTEWERMEIAENKPSVRVAARNYGVSETAMRKIFRDIFGDQPIPYHVKRERVSGFRTIEAMIKSPRMDVKHFAVRALTVSMETHLPALATDERLALIHWLRNKGFIPEEQGC